MDILITLLLIGLAAFLFLVGCGTILLKLVGFSTGKALVITLSFLFCGIWNPVGWIVLAVCTYLQYKETKQVLLDKAPEPTALQESRVLIRGKM